MPQGYPEKIETLGEHIRARRLEREEYQKHVADRIDVTVETLINWELGKTSVMTKFYPAIADYLGYCLIPDEAEALSLVVLVKRHRLYRGLSIKSAARIIGVDETSLSGWENKRARPTEATRTKLMAFIESSARSLL